MKHTLIWFNLHRDETGNGLSNIKDAFAESLQLQISVLHQSVCISSQVHMMAGQNMKKKYLMCQILIKILKQQAIPNSSLHNFKTYSSKGCRKTSQRCRWIKLPSQHSNYKYSNFQQKISLQIIGFSFDWWIHLLIWNSETTQNLLFIFITTKQKQLFS